MTCTQCQLRTMVACCSTCRGYLAKLFTPDAREALSAAREQEGRTIGDLLLQVGAVQLQLNEARGLVEKRDREIAALLRRIEVLERRLGFCNLLVRQWWRS